MDNNTMGISETKTSEETDAQEDLKEDLQEVPTVILTDIAAEMVKKIMGDEDVPLDTPLRIRVVGGGCAGFSYDLVFEKEKPTALDTVTKVNGVDIIIDQMSLMYLAGVEIDYVEALAGTGFRFNNPNVTSTCGCGSSFTV